MSSRIYALICLFLSSFSVCACPSVCLPVSLCVFLFPQSLPFPSLPFPHPLYWRWRVCVLREGLMGKNKWLAKKYIYSQEIMNTRRELSHGGSASRDRKRFVWFFIYLTDCILDFLKEKYAGEFSFLLFSLYSLYLPDSYSFSLPLVDDFSSPFFLSNILFTFCSLVGNFSFMHFSFMHFSFSLFQFLSVALSLSKGLCYFVVNHEHLCP